MNYFIQILWLLCWPALICISYLAVSWAVERFEKELEEQPHDEI